MKEIDANILRTVVTEMSMMKLLHTEDETVENLLHEGLLTEHEATHLMADNEDSRNNARNYPLLYKSVEEASKRAPSPTSRWRGIRAIRALGVMGGGLGGGLNRKTSGRNAAAVNMSRMNNGQMPITSSPVGRISMDQE